MATVSRRTLATSSEKCRDVLTCTVKQADLLLADVYSNAFNSMTSFPKCAAERMAW